MTKIGLELWKKFPWVIEKISLSYLKIREKIFMWDMCKVTMLSYYVTGEGSKMSKNGLKSLNMVHKKKPPAIWGDRGVSCHRGGQSLQLSPTADRRGHVCSLVCWLEEGGGVGRSKQRGRRVRIRQTRRKAAPTRKWQGAGVRDGALGRGSCAATKFEIGTLLFLSIRGHLPHSVAGIREMKTKKSQGFWMVRQDWP